MSGFKKFIFGGGVGWGRLKFKTKGIGTLLVRMYYSLCQVSECLQSRRMMGFHCRHQDEGIFGVDPFFSSLNF